VRIATWNVNSVKQRVPRLLPWLDERRPDVVCLQETKLADDAFADLLGDELAERDYAVALHGEATWNGVAILSRVGLEDVAVGLPGGPGFPHPESRAVSATCGGIRVVSVYVPNGREPGSEHYEYKLAWLASLREMVAAGPDATVVCGDMNIAPTDDDVFDPDAYVGQTHVTPPEREALAERASVQLLGLSGRDVPPGSRDADRPDPGERFGGWPRPSGMGRPPSSQGQGAQRSRPGDRRPGRGARRGHRAGSAAAVPAGGQTRSQETPPGSLAP
jgi:exodeoxyribonuclease III